MASKVNDGTLRKGDCPSYTKSSCKTIGKGTHLIINWLFRSEEVQKAGKHEDKIHLVSMITRSSNQGNANKSYNDISFPNYQIGREWWCAP